MSDSVLAILATIGWVLVTAVLLGLFGTTSGGAWSIAGGVARGVREWSSPRRTAPPEGPPPQSPESQTEDLGERPIR